DKFKADPDSFSLAIVDVLMPVMGGEELVQEIAKIRPDFPILLSSGYAPKSSLDEKIKKKEIEFLPKPYRSRQLLEKVEQMLNTSQ
ncbi:MAG: response regulator, partial [Candidatus Omnitrophica bacterium]|nr:response regulator [Candidatus Omnitrophota bacterium]